MLELRGVHVGYGRIEVVHGIDLSIGPGEVVGMIGPNGAGKSSILRSICGLVRPTAGEAVFEGRVLTGMAPELIARLGLSLVPEGRHIFKTLTVAENLRLGAPSEDDGAAWIERTLDRFPILRERADRRADCLSGGEQQQLAIARALVGRPKLLILDEPSLGLAPKMIAVIYELLQNLRDEGVTMLLVEQNAARTIDFSDRCVVLSTGKVRAQGSRGELQRNPDVLRAYLGRQP
ncbi:MAG: branched-chain amino acid transport system ATP-binding protein [Solirubrobacterales bacterium]|jgi:branched-chain amino acid transport system ATP-binding protein|nr:branched-chain amino acid transport system ATP-binding protein [Solirubrobacterales bacterium]